MRLLSIIVISTFAALEVSGQRIVMGEVRLKADSTFLPAVNVLEKHKDNGVTTDGSGRFRIECSSSSPVLEFSFVGLRTVEVDVGNDYVFVLMEEDEELLKEKTRFGIYPRYTSIGLSAGVAYTPIGFNVRNALPILFGLRMLTTTSIMYRTDLNGNQYLDIRLRKDHLMNTPYLGRHFNIEFGYGMRMIGRRNDHWNVQELDVISEYISGGIVIRLGYGVQSFNETESLKSNPGLILGAGGHFRNYASVVTTAKKWAGYWQTETRFLKGFSKNDFEIGLGVETLERYAELDLMLIYRIHY